MSAPSKLQGASAAFESVRDEVAALQPHEVMRVNVDVSRAASRVLRAAPQILALLPAMDEHLPTLPRARIEKLETYGLAAWYAHSCVWQIKVVSATKDVAIRARPLRHKLLMAAQVFAEGGFIDKDRVGGIRAGQGRLDMAKDMIALSALLQAAWPRISATTIVTQSELQQAATLGAE